MESEDGVEDPVEALTTQILAVAILDVENKECQTVDIEDESEKHTEEAEVIDPADDSSYELVDECSFGSEDADDEKELDDSPKLEDNCSEEQTVSPEPESEENAPTKNQINEPEQIATVAYPNAHEKRGQKHDYRKGDTFEDLPLKMVDKIVNYAEFYFSDWNIFKNNFLLKHIKRNKERYISVKLLASFRKIKALTRDWRVVVLCVERSKLLELNPEKTKVRRVEPIPEVHETALGKTVIAYNLPPTLKPNNDELKDLFSKFGAVVSAQVITPKSQTYNIYHKRCSIHHHDVASYTFGVIEFERYEDALKALKDEERDFPKDKKTRVVPLLPQVNNPTTRRGSRYYAFSRNSGRGRGRLPSRPLLPRNQFRSRCPFDYEPARRPMSEAFYRNQYWRQSPTHTQSCNDIRGKLPMDYNIRKMPLDNNTRGKLPVDNNMGGKLQVDNHFRAKLPLEKPSRGKPPMDNSIRGKLPMEGDIGEKLSMDYNIMAPRVRVERGRNRRQLQPNSNLKV